MNTEPEKKNIGTPYDDAFRTMLVDCIRLVIPVINEVFGKNYIGTEDIIQHPNEHFIIQQDDEEKRITDGNFTIRGAKDETYLFECQSMPDSSMLIRIWEYIVQIAMERGTVEKNRMIVRIPNAAVLYLRSTSTTPDVMDIVVEAPTGSLSFPVPVMKIKNYSLDAIFGKKLYFLLPFYIFTHEGEFESHQMDAEWLDRLREEYVNIRTLLDEAVQNGLMPYHYRATIIEMTKKVVENIAVRYERIREGVNEIMGGQVLEYESKTIFKEGVEQGRQEGRQEGIEMMVIKLYNSGMSIDKIAEIADVPVNIVKQWIEVHTA